MVRKHIWKDLNECTDDDGLSTYYGLDERDRATPVSQIDALGKEAGHRQGPTCSNWLFTPMWDQRAGSAVNLPLSYAQWPSL